MKNQKRFESIRRIRSAAAALGIMSLLALPLPVRAQDSGMDMSNMDMSQGGMQMNMPRGQAGTGAQPAQHPSAPPPPAAGQAPVASRGTGIPPMYPTSGAVDLDQAIFNYTRLEGDIGRSQGQSAQNWEAEGWVGTDKNRFWWKSEGERRGGKTETGDLQALYSRYLVPFWDFQAGVRHQFKPDKENDLVVGVKGLAPYKFDVDAAAFVSTHGAVSARLKGEYELLLTQRVVARPFAEAEMTFANGSDPTRIEGSGLNRLSAGMQVRYEITRKIAPYVRIAHERVFSGLAREARERGEGASSNVVSAGLRLIF